MSKFLIRAISVLEIVGGLAGIGLITWSVLSQPLDFRAFPVFLFAVGVDCLSLAAGIALWRGTSFGQRASIAVQLIQIPKIVSPAIIFMFSFGFDLWIHFLITDTFSSVGFQTTLFAYNQLFLNVGGAPFDIGVSVTGIVFLFALLRYRPRKPTEVLPPPPPIDFAVHS
jgi:hypothetical protein